MKCKGLFLTTRIFWHKGLSIMANLNKFYFENLVNHILDIVC
jgi:hypothetical protein